jgi:hypothetical protein
MDNHAVVFVFFLCSIREYMDNDTSYKIDDCTMFLHNMKSLTCRDAGFDCGAVIKGETEDEIMQKAGCQKT